jgi:hypothetical protein
MPATNKGAERAPAAPTARSRRLSASVALGEATHFRGPRLCWNDARCCELVAYPSLLLQLGDTGVQLVGPGVLVKGTAGGRSTSYARSPVWLSVVGAPSCRHFFLYGGVVGMTLVKLTMSHPALRFSST